jgi:hypothetical protein
MMHSRRQYTESGQCASTRTVASVPEVKFQYHTNHHDGQIHTRITKYGWTAAHPQ